MATRFDAVIVGGGPAGALTALRLAQLGWRTALVESGGRGRTKTCGHCLNPRGLSILKRHGLHDDVLRLSVGQTRTLRVHLSNGQRLQSSLLTEAAPSWIGGILIERQRLDQLLIDRAAAAGAEIMQPASARILSFDDASRVIDVTSEGRHLVIQSPLLIGADGVGSAVARASGLADRASIGRKFGFSFDLSQRSGGIINPGAIEMFVAPGGYLGVVEQQEGFLHFAALVSSNKDYAGRDPVSFVRSLVPHHPQLRELGLDSIQRNRFENFSAVGPMPWRPRTIADARTALVGDAAGYVEPFTGEGMSWAMQSAEVLGEVLADISPGAWNEHVARHYAGAWKRCIGRRQRACRFMAFALARPRISSMVFRTGAEFPMFARRFVQKVMTS